MATIEERRAKQRKRRAEQGKEPFKPDLTSEEKKPPSDAIIPDPTRDDKAGRVTSVNLTPKHMT